MNTPSSQYDTRNVHRPDPSRSWPRQVYNILGNEAAERFSYYGMKGLLAAYITSMLLKSGDEATHIVHLFVSVNYFMPLFGAWLADKVCGRYHTILWVSLFYCLGHGVLALSDVFPDVQSRSLCLYAGLGLIAFGSGGIKPCVSAFMGDQFTGPGSRLGNAYAAFYWCINLGSLAAFLLVPWTRDHFGYGWAFGIPGIAMALAKFIFWLGRAHYIHLPVERVPGWEKTGFLWLAGIGLFAYSLLTGNWWITGGAAALAFAFWVFQSAKKLAAGISADPGAFASLLFAATPLGSRLSPEARENGAGLGRVLSIFALVPVFWALFDQTGSTWVLQGKQMVEASILGYTIDADRMQSMNPLIVMSLVPLFTLVLYPLAGRLATPLRRMSIGMFLAAASYVIVAQLQARIEAGEKLSILWQMVPYVVLTAAEVLISTTGLEFAYTQASKAMKSTIGSMWLLTVSAGNLFVVLITRVMGDGSDASSVTSLRFMQYAGLTAIVGVIFSVIAAFYKYRNQEGTDAA